MFRQPNGGVDAAARFHVPFAGPAIVRNTLPSVASNDVLCGKSVFGLHQTARVMSGGDVFKPDIARQ